MFSNNFLAFEKQMFLPFLGILIIKYLIMHTIFRLFMGMEIVSFCSGAAQPRFPR